MRSIMRSASLRASAVVHLCETYVESTRTKRH